jgi:RNA polymerase sigma-70 factor (ECF subfamily)
MTERDRLSTPEDETGRLAARARTGDRAAFDTIVRRYADMVTGLAWKFLGSRDDALDCAQDSFVKAWENIDRYDPKWSLATWLRRIVTNTALDRLRRRRFGTELPEGFEELAASDEESPAEAAQRHERALSVHEVLAGLPAKYRAVLVLRDMEGVDTSEIAVITGANAATVRWRLHRARALFKDHWSAAQGREHGDGL